MEYDGSQRQHGFIYNIGYSNSNVGYSQRTDTLIQAYIHILTLMPQQVSFYTPITQQNSSCQFGSVAGLNSSVPQSFGHPKLVLSPTPSVYLSRNSS
ncbi:hypothetical protein V6N11_001368 [Hibiscus sabdariffa]|uniref:Uncharacterized protein n=1 Tax=Hibiscus sabdariffa TaxID=183260 RepID=A0ABR2RZT3_9ROSI